MITISAKQIEALYDLIIDDRHGWYQQLRHSLDWLALDGLANLPQNTLAMIAAGMWSADWGMQEHPDAVLIHDPLTEAPMQDAEYPEVRKFVRGEIDSPCNCTPVLAPHVYRLQDGTEVTVTGMYSKAGPQSWSGHHRSRWPSR